MRTPHGLYRMGPHADFTESPVMSGLEFSCHSHFDIDCVSDIMVVLTSVESLSSPSPIIAAFARAAVANVPAVDDDDEKLDDKEDVDEDEEKNEDENREHDDQIVNKRKRKLQQVVLISSRVTVINWMIADADQNGEQGLVLRAIAKFPSEFRGNYKVCRVRVLIDIDRIQANHTKATRWWKMRDEVGEYGVRESVHP